MAPTREMTQYTVATSSPDPCNGNRLTERLGARQDKLNCAVGETWLRSQSGFLDGARGALVAQVFTIGALAWIAWIGIAAGLLATCLTAFAFGASAMWVRKERRRADVPRRSLYAADPEPQTTTESRRPPVSGQTGRIVTIKALLPLAFDGLSERSLGGSLRRQLGARQCTPSRGTAERLSQLGGPIPRAQQPGPRSSLSTGCQRNM
jgi:hypothetical protein